MLMPSSRAGFSLIELLVGLAILAMLLALGLPAMRDFMTNSRLRGVAADFSAAAQLARSEAIQRNGGVDLVLTSDVPSTATVASATSNASGPHWMVRALQGTDTYTLLDAHVAGEGSQRAGGGSAVVLSSSTGTATLAFSGFGATVPSGTTAQFNFTSPSLGNCVSDNTPGPVRCLRVQVSAAGQVRLCDPAVGAATDPRHCN